MKIEVATHVIYRQSRDCRRFLFLRVFFARKGSYEVRSFDSKKEKKIIKENESQLTATLTTNAFRFVRLALSQTSLDRFFYFLLKASLFSSIVPYFLLLTQPLSIRRRRRTRAHTTKPDMALSSGTTITTTNTLRAQNTQKKSNWTEHSKMNSKRRQCHTISTDLTHRYESDPP